MDNLAKIVITTEVIESLETARGGYTNESLRFITGDTRKPSKGWKWRYIGQVRSRRAYIALLEKLAERDILKPRKGQT